MIVEVAEEISVAAFQRAVGCIFGITAYDDGRSAVVLHLRQLRQRYLLLQAAYHHPVIFLRRRATKRRVRYQRVINPTYRPRSILPRHALIALLL